MWVSRTKARSDAYARSDDKSSSNACVRFDTAGSDRARSPGGPDGVLEAAARGSMSWPNDVGVGKLESSEGVLGNGLSPDKE